MSEELKAVLAQIGVEVESIQSVSDTPVFVVWLGRRYAQAVLKSKLEGSKFNCIGGGLYRGKPMAIVMSDGGAA